MKQIGNILKLQAKLIKLKRCYLFMAFGILIKKGIMGNWFLGPDVMQENKTANQTVIINRFCAGRVPAGDTSKDQ